MADSVCLVANHTTTGGASMTATATPAGGLPLIATAQATGDTGTWTLTDSSGATWTKILRTVKATSADIEEVWVCDSLSTNASRTLTYARVGAAATGAGVSMFEITGASRTGTSLIRSSGVTDNIASGVAASVVMNQAPLAANLTMTGIYLATSGPGTIAPTNFTSIIVGNPTGSVTSSFGYATPTTGGKVARSTATFTSATVTWGSTFGSAGCAWAIEVDASAPDIPMLAMAPFQGAS